MNSIIHSTRFVGAIIVALLGCVTAQDARPASTRLSGFGPHIVPIHTQASDEGVEYGIWGAGRRYKVSFHDGMTFVPYLGRDYPVAQSLQWRTRSVRIGEHLLYERQGAPQLTHTDERAEFDLGAIVEAYDLRADEVEQTFVIAERPAEAGDLVVTGVVESALAGRMEQPGGHAAIEFVDSEGRPIASYGAATAIDARGRRQAMTTTIEGDVVTLRLDREWLEAAAFPLVVDPLLGVLYSWTGLAFDETDLLRTTVGVSHNIWHVATYWTSQTDADLRLQRTSDNGVGAAWMYTDITASWSTIEPSLGQHRGDVSVLAAFSRHFHGSNTRRVRFHKHSIAVLAQQTHWTAIDVGGNQSWRPDVSSSLHPQAPNQLLVVFQQENLSTFAPTLTSHVRGSLVDLAGNGTAGTTFPIADAPGEDNERPDVGMIRTGGPWTVAYQVIGNSPLVSPHLDWDVEICRVDRLGNVSAPTRVLSSVHAHEIAPRVGGFDDRFLIVFASGDVAELGGRPDSPLGRRIGRRGYEWAGGTLSSPGATWLAPASGSSEWELTGVAMDSRSGSHLLVSMIDRTRQDVWMRLCHWGGASLGAFVVEALPASSRAFGGAVAFDASAGRFLIGFTERTLTSTWNHVELYAGTPAPAPIDTGPSCGSPAQVEWAGSQFLGSEDCGVQLTGVPNGALGVVVAGLAPFSAPLAGVPPVHPACWALVPNTGATSLGALPFGFGPTITTSLPLPWQLGPMFLFFQGAHFDAAGNTVYTTQRLEVQVVRYQ
ncbi:MAG: hypothetical protein NXI31_17660 [bacterium]|nr:hypothetical protein [bacterium]